MRKHPRFKDKVHDFWSIHPKSHANNPWTRLEALHTSFFAAVDWIRGNPGLSRLDDDDRIGVAIALLKEVRGLKRYKNIRRHHKLVPELHEAVCSSLNMGAGLNHCDTSVECVDNLIYHWENQVVGGKIAHMKDLGANAEVIKKDAAKFLAELKPRSTQKSMCSYDPATGRPTVGTKRIVQISRDYWKAVWEGFPVLQEDMPNYLASYPKRIDPMTSWDISIETVENAILQCPNTAPGPDGIPFEGYKYCLRSASSILHEVIKDLLGPDPFHTPDIIFDCLLFFLPKSLLTPLINRIFSRLRILDLSR